MDYEMIICNLQARVSALEERLGIGAHPVTPVVAGTDPHEVSDDQKRSIMDHFSPQQLALDRGSVRFFNKWCVVGKFLESKLQFKITRKAVVLSNFKHSVKQYDTPSQLLAVLWP